MLRVYLTLIYYIKFRAYIDRTLLIVSKTFFIVSKTDCNFRPMEFRGYLTWDRDGFYWSGNHLGSLTLGVRPQLGESAPD